MRILLLSLLLVAIHLVGCKKDATIWTSDWSAPIVNDSLSLDNLVNDSTLTTNSGIYELDLHRSLFNLNINDVLSIPDTTIEVNYTIPFSFFNVPPGYSFVNEADEYSFDLDGLELKKVRLSSGFLDIEVQNPAPTLAFFNLKMPGVTKNSVELDETFVIPGLSNGTNGTSSNSFNLAGYFLDLTGVLGNVRNTLRADINVSSDPNGPTVTLYNTDKINVKVTLRDLKIDYAKGYFGQKIISDTTDIPIDVLEMIQSGNVDLPASTIKFEVENGIKVGANALITKISNENYNGSVVSLTHPQIGTSFNIDPATGTWNTLLPSHRFIEFTNANSNIEAYLENLGASHSVGYKVELNPWGNVSGGSDELFAQSNIAIKLHANMPLTIGADDLIVRDTFDFSISQDMDKTHLVSGELLLNVRNAFPFSADIKLMFIDENGSILHTLVTPESIASAQFGALESSTNLMVSGTEMSLVLSEDLVSDLEKITAIIVESEFDSTDPLTNLNVPYSIPVGAFLGVKLKGKFKTENKF